MASKDEQKDEPDFVRDWVAGHEALMAAVEKQYPGHRAWFDEWRKTCQFCGQRLPDQDKDDL